MKIEGTRKSKMGDDHTVYIFSVGADELLLIYEAADKLRKETPKGVLSFMPTRGRLGNILKEINKVILEHGIRKEIKQKQNVHI